MFDQQDFFLPYPKIGISYKVTKEEEDFSDSSRFFSALFIA